MKAAGKVDRISDSCGISPEERALYREALRAKNRRQFTRKNVDAYVDQLLGERKKITVEDLPLDERRDLIRLVYISIYAGNASNCYKVKRTGKKIRRGDFEFPYYEIYRR